VIASLIGAFYYLRVVKVMYFDEPSHEHSVTGSGITKGVLGLNGLMVLLLGIFPAGLMALCLNIMRNTLIGS
jgi:NADH-quinone oxidoreductase subunit N